MNIKDKSSDEIIKYSTVEYGRELNLNRHIPFALDGLKPSYRRVILSALEMDNNTLQKTSKLLANTSKFHVHDTDSLKGVASELVNWGVLDGQGNWGMQGLDIELPCAAARYTEVKLNNSFKEMSKSLMKYVPTFKNELGYDEHQYIPSPLPFLLQFGGIGMGIGCKVVFPAFTKESLLNAYLNDDYTLLKFEYGYNMLSGDLKSIWEGNTNSIFELSFPYKETEDEIIVQGVPGLFKINFKNINKFIDDGQILKVNKTNKKNGNNLVFKKQYNARKITDDVLRSTIKNAISKKINFNMLVHDYSSVYEIGIKAWIDITYKNYINLLKQHNKSKIEDINFEISVNNNFNSVGKLIVEKKKDEEISKILNIDIDIVKVISKKSINSFRTPKEFDNSNLYNQLKDIEKFNYEKYIRGIILNE
jgi:hypothetical protein